VGEEEKRTMAVAKKSGKDAKEMALCAFASLREYFFNTKGFLLKTSGVYPKSVGGRTPNRTRD